MAEIDLLFMKATEPFQQDGVDFAAMERKTRRALKKVGYALRKSRAPISSDNLGGYMLVDLSTNAVVAGSRYELTLGEAGAWLETKEEGG